MSEKNPSPKQKRNLTRRIINLNNIIFNHPWLYTITYAGMGTAITAQNPASYEIGAGFLGAGLLGDMVRRGVNWASNRKWHNELSNISKVMGLDCFDDIVKQIKTENNYRGKFVKLEVRGRQEGTGLFRGGYFTKLDLLFGDGNRKKLIYKYNDKPNLNVGGTVTTYLRELGHKFVPKRYAHELFAAKKLGAAGRQLSRGQLYEYIEGDTLENLVIKGEKPTQEKSQLEMAQVARLFKNMFSIYSHKTTNQLKSGEQFMPYPAQDLDSTTGASSFNQSEHRFHQKLLSSIDDSDLHKILSTTYNQATQDQNLCLIHGDLHQGNLIDTGESLDLRIIDWDSAQLGIPYQDFIHFATITDLEKEPSFEAARAQIIAAQEKIIGPVKPEYLKLIEFETYFSLLNRYFSTMEQGQIREEFWPNLLNSCAYLLNKAKQSLADYSEITRTDQLAEEFAKYSENRFGDLNNLEPDEKTSVAYAHTTNHQYRIDADNIAEENFQKHLLNVENIVVSETNNRNMMSGDVAINATFITGAALVGKYQGIEIPPELIGMGITAVALAVAINQQERIINGITKYARKLMN